MKFVIHSMALVAALTVAGCGSLHADYVAADEETYKYAQPKLEAWAKTQDAEWQGIVKDKGVAWKARIDRAKKKLKEDGGE